MRKLAFPKSASKDEILSALRAAEDSEIQLFFPAAAAFFKNAQHVHDLRNEARQHGKEIVVVTPDTEGQRLAKDSGLRVLNEQGNELFAAAEERGFAPHVFEQLSAFTQKVHQQEELVAEDVLGVTHSAPLAGVSKFGSGALQFARQRALWIGALVLLFAGSFFAANAFEQLEITIRPNVEDIQLSLPLQVSVTPSDNQSVVAGQIIEVNEEVKNTFSATGENSVSERARGIIRVFNNYNTQDQTLIAQTRFVSESGKLFRSNETVVVPGMTIDENGNKVKSSVEVEVVAAEPGEEYNIPPSIFSIPGFQGTPKYTAFYGESSEPMRGGAEGTVAVLTEEDRTKAEAEIKTALEEKLNQSFDEKMPKDMILIDGAFSVSMIIKTDREVGSPGQTFEVVGQGKKTAFLFREADVVTKIEAALVSKLQQNVGLMKEKTQLRYTVEELSLDTGLMSIQVEITSQVAWRIDIPAVQELVAGKSEKEIREAFASRPEIGSARISFRPFWLNKAPLDHRKIKVRVTLD